VGASVAEQEFIFWEFHFHYLSNNQVKCKYFYNAKRHIHHQKQTNMAEMISVNVYQIDGANLTPQKWGFSPSRIRAKSVSGVVMSGSVRVYSEIHEYPSGSGNSYRKYAVVETVDALKALADA
jgi:hypothetical protein